MNIRTWQDEAGERGLIANEAAECMIREIAELRAASDQARKTNQELHRRLQKAEAPAQSYAAQLGYQQQMHSKQWSFEFKRLCSAHQEMKLVFHECCRVIGYPLNGHYLHSVMDMKIDDNRGSRTDELYANCFIQAVALPGPNIGSYRVVDEVKKVVDELLAARAALKDATLSSNEYHILAAKAFAREDAEMRAKRLANKYIPATGDRRRRHEEN